VDGVLVCDKPAGPTSHDLVALVRRLAGQRRVGHGGTLDPPATGVLVVALGRATRLLPWLPLEPKGYLATIRFGSATDTLDATGTVTAVAPAGHLDAAAVAAALAGMTGAQQQVPPMVSAVKVGGERLYAKARRGEQVERAARPVTVHSLDLVELRPGPAPEAVVAISCSGGTYVRSLADDLGRAVGSAAHLAALRRTRAGAFALDRAHRVDELRSAAGRGALQELLLAPAEAIAGVPARRLEAGEAAAVAVGRPLAASGRAGPVAAIGPDGRLLAVVEDERGLARPRVVLA
jgi:tRNA pseudouridine55 synthase